MHNNMTDICRKKQAVRQWSHTRQDQVTVRSFEGPGCRRVVTRDTTCQIHTMSYAYINETPTYEEESHMPLFTKLRQLVIRKQDAPRDPFRNLVPLEQTFESDGAYDMQPVGRFFRASKIRTVTPDTPPVCRLNATDLSGTPFTVDVRESHFFYNDQYQILLVPSPAAYRAARRDGVDMHLYPILPLVFGEHPLRYILRAGLEDDELVVDQGAQNVVFERPAH